MPKFVIKSDIKTPVRGYHRVFLELLVLPEDKLESALRSLALVAVITHKVPYGPTYSRIKEGFLEWRKQELYHAQGLNKA